ncbi:hypothetical protein [Botrimarina sp.]|uniref:hypothetical protein n=1 Tax=Botrimarina sp. TaxID=2795802 RepID=UPI0032ED7B22
MSTTTRAADHASLAKPLAPEDVRAGDYVAVLDEELQWCAANWYCDPPPHGERVIHVRLRPREAAPPLRVLDACLPFVFVEPPDGAGYTLDLRAVRLARLDKGYARRVVKAMRGVARSSGKNRSKR